MERNTSITTGISEKWEDASKETLCAGSVIKVPTDATAGNNNSTVNDCMKLLF